MALENRILALISAADLERMMPFLEEIDLPRLFVMEEADEPISHVYFPSCGIGSIVATNPEGDRVEVGVFGCEGMSGLALCLGSDRSPMTTFVQVRGAGVRIRADVFVEMIEQSPGLHRQIMRYAQAHHVQVAQTALSNAKHTVEERLARWLLMCHDRMPFDEIGITHDFLALMLGVRRASITNSIHVLEGAQIVRNVRSLVTIRDRLRLEEAAGGAYGVAEREYSRLMAQPVAA